MSQDKIQLLNQIDFAWDIKESEWQEKYQELIQYRELSGDTNVPLTCQDNPALARWVAKQRIYYIKKGNLQKKG